MPSAAEGLIIPAEKQFLVSENCSHTGLTVVLKKSLLFWVVMPFSSQRTKCFRATYIPHIEGLKINKARNQ
jgi:hypothetical protein